MKKKVIIVVGKPLDVINANEFLFKKGLHDATITYITFNKQPMEALKYQKQNFVIRRYPYPKLYTTRFTRTYLNFFLKNEKVAEFFRRLLSYIWWWICYVVSKTRLLFVGKTDYFLCNATAMHLFFVPLINPKKIILYDEGVSTLNWDLVSSVKKHGVLSLLKSGLNRKGPCLPRTIKKKIIGNRNDLVYFFTSYMKEEKAKNVMQNEHNYYKTIMKNKKVHPGLLLVLGNIKSGDSFSFWDYWAPVISYIHSCKKNDKLQLTYKPHPREKIDDDVKERLQQIGFHIIYTNKSVEFELFESDVLPSRIISWGSSSAQVFKNTLPENVEIIDPLKTLSKRRRND